MSGISTPPTCKNGAGSLSSHPSDRERDDSYLAIIIDLTPRWRVIACKHGAQWVIQHRTADPLHRGVWRGRSYVTTRESLIKACARVATFLDPPVMAILLALPDRIGGKHEQRIEPHSPTKIDSTSDELRLTAPNSLPKG
jgi:hypothetical protein